MSRLAVIDIGTNSTLYLLVEMKQQEIITVDQSLQAARLGKHMDKEKKIQGASLLQVIGIINRFKQMAISQKAERIIVVGTRALRAAKNRKDICKQIEKETRLKVKILSEKEEARWSYLGAIYGREFKRTTLVVDIGGGSTEFICGTGNLIDDLKSLNLGAVNLTERFFKNNQPERFELDAIKTFIKLKLNEDVGMLLASGELFLAVGGTATTLAVLNQKLSQYDPQLVDGHSMTKETVDTFIKEFQNMSLNQKRKWLHVDPARADIILTGTMILQSIMVLGNYDSFTVSDRGLRFGIALRETIYQSIN